MKSMDIIGNLTEDVKKITTDKVEFLTFKVAVNGWANKQKTTDYINVNTKIDMDYLLSNLKKGAKVFVRGTPEFKSFNDKPDIKIWANIVECLSNKDTQNKSKDITPLNTDIIDDDIPF